MAILMAALTRSKNGDFVTRKGIPKDVRVEYERYYGVRWEAKFNQPGTASVQEAKARSAEWLSEIETRIATLRAAKSGTGQPLTKLNALALAGKWYAWFIALHENDPGPPLRWRELDERLVWGIVHPEAPTTFHENPQADPEWEWAKSPEVRAKVRPVIAEMSRAASFLVDSGVSLNSDAHALFVDAVSDNLHAAFTLLEQRARGDYTTDKMPESFPAYTGVQGSTGSQLDCMALFAAFVTAVQPADSTVQRWRAVFLHLQSAYPQASAAALSEADARAWAAKLVTLRRSAATVSSVWIPAAKRVFSWAETQKHIRKSPFVGIKVDVPKTSQNRESKAFTPEEADVILRATLEHKTPKSTFEKARRWVMWLCAYSGARAGEITQLRGSDVVKRGTFYAMSLTPEAGTIKSKQARVVPLHEHLIEQGFIEFVQQQGKGPLFYNAAKAQSAAHDPLNPKQVPAAKTRARLGEWVRDLGVIDTELSPTHGWRHTFKQTADRAGIPEKVHDAITGHVATTEGRKYGKPTVEDMAKALKKFPRYALKVEQADEPRKRRGGKSKTAAAPALKTKS
jgi:integrase